MSLYKRGNVWWIKLTQGGAPTIRETTGTADRRAAQEYHDRRAAELWRVRRLGERPRTTFADAAADWIETHAKDKASYADDQLRMRIMLPLLPEYLDELTTTRLTKIRDALRKPRQVVLKTRTGKQRTVTREIGRSTANKYLALLSAILRHAHRREWIAAVPAIPMFRKLKGKRFTLLTLEKAAELLEALPPHLQAMTRFALATGLRDANVRELRWENVDLSARIARVWPEDAKAGQPIPVPLNSAAIEVLQAQLGRHPTHVFVYECIRWRDKEKVIVRTPITLRSNNTAWRKARARVGLPDLRFHDLRHSWATWHKAAGTPDFELQQMGGWSDSRMLRVYAHLAAEQLLAHADRITVPSAPQGTKLVTAPGSGSEVAADFDEKEFEIRVLGGVADGIRTHNNRNHNPGLYR